MHGTVSITFDDGLASIYSLALPELERVGATATVFVISDLVGKKFLGQPVTSGRMLRSLSSKGWEIASHTRTHPNLTELSDIRANAELRDSKARLEDIVSADVVSLAYPFGAYDARIKAIAARHYTFARSGSSYPPLRVNNVCPPDPMELKAVNTYEHAYFLPLHLFENYIARNIGHRPKPKPRNPNLDHARINSSRKALEARFVRKWLRKLRSNQWLILTLHDISTQKSPTSYSIPIKEFREIVKAIAQSAEIVNLGEGAQSA